MSLELECSVLIDVTALCKPAVVLTLYVAALATAGIARIRAPAETAATMRARSRGVIFVLISRFPPK